MNKYLFFKKIIKSQAIIYYYLFEKGGIKPSIFKMISKNRWNSAKITKIYKKKKKKSKKIYGIIITVATIAPAIGGI